MNYRVGAEVPLTLYREMQKQVELRIYASLSELIREALVQLLYGPVDEVLENE